MAFISQVREHMDIIGADGVHVGTVDKVEGDRIKMTRADSGSHSSHHHFSLGGLISGISAYVFSIRSRRYGFPILIKLR